MGIQQSKDGLTLEMPCITFLFHLVTVYDADVSCLLINCHKFTPCTFKSVLTRIVEDFNECLTRNEMLKVDIIDRCSPEVDNYENINMHILCMNSLLLVR